MAVFGLIQFLANLESQALFMSDTIYIILREHMSGAYGVYAESVVSHNNRQATKNRLVGG